MGATDWNFADVWETCAEVRPTSDALVHGTVRQSWREVDRRAGGLARFLLEAGLGRQEKVAQYLYNSNEYLESVFGCFKAGLVPVNTNYRYGLEELAYLWDNADAAAIVFHGAFTERVDALRDRLPKVRAYLHVDDGTGPCPPFATPYEEAAAALGDDDDPRVRAPWGRSGDDLYLLYTGGTTGMPKGVMWRQDDLFALLNEGSLAPLPDDDGMAGIRRGLEALAASPPVVMLPACPLMHGTGAFTAFGAWDVGGCIVTLVGRSFDPLELLETVEREHVNIVSLVGDAFAKPILAALDANPGRFDLSSLVAMISSGVMWSEQTKHGLLRHHPGMVLVDAFSSSEALGMGTSVASNGTEPHTASFRIGERAKVVDDEGREVAPGSGVVGRLALGGRIPLGYYKDPQKTAATFVTIDGVRYSVPGDYATVEADGTLRLLGRGSVVINTGGEKVFPEEVEEVLKTHPDVLDAACVGVPDERFGEAICALVERRPGSTVAEADLVEHVKARLASFKAPRHVVLVASVGRSPAGKLDYERLRHLARSRVAAASGAAS
jgi:acyl-CoA synthetase (AMP-forming)/AMP-acid ligase II